MARPAIAPRRFPPSLRSGSTISITGPHRDTHIKKWPQFRGPFIILIVPMTMALNDHHSIVAVVIGYCSRSLTRRLSQADDLFLFLTSEYTTTCRKKSLALVQSPGTVSTLIRTFPKVVAW
jgi:hypothetical protein